MTAAIPDANYGGWPRRRGPKNLGLLIGLSVLFGGTSLLMIGSEQDPALRLTRYAVDCAGLGLLVPALSSVRGWTLQTHALLGAALWCSFAFVCILSALANGDSITTLSGMAWILFGVPLLLFTALPNVLKRTHGTFVIWCMLLGHLPYLVLSAARVEEYRSMFAGIMMHANCLGMIATIEYVCAVSLLTMTSRRASRWRAAFLLALAALALAMLFLSASRTSALSAAITTVLIAACRSGRRGKAILIVVLMLVPVVYFVFDSMGNGSLLSGLWLKNEKTLFHGDLLSKRDRIWEKTLEDTQPLGNGDRYFTDEVGISAHNSLIHVLGQRGPFAAVLVVCFAGVSFIAAFRHFRANRDTDPSAMWPLVISCVFWTVSQGEAVLGSLGNGLTLAYLLSCGSVFASAFRKPGTRTADVPFFGPAIVEP